MLVQQKRNAEKILCMQSLLIFLFRLLSENKKVLAEALSYFYGNFVSIVIKLRKYNQKLLISVTSVFLFAIFASVNFVLLIGKNKYLDRQLVRACRCG